MNKNLYFPGIFENNRPDPDVCIAEATSHVIVMGVWIALECVS